MTGKLRSSIEAVFASLFVLLLPLRWIIQQMLAQRAYSIWCGVPIITLAHNARVEKLLGVRAISIVTHTYYITKQFDFDLSLLVKGRVMRYIASWAALAFMFFFAKRVHTYFDGGVLPALQKSQFNRHELLVYKIANLEHFVWTYGADVRVQRKTQMLGNPNCCSGCDDVGRYCICSSEIATVNVNRVMATAVAAFSMGDMIEYTPGSHNRLFFWPIDLDAMDGLRYRLSCPTNEEGRPLRVVHAPNHRQFKGTNYLEAAVKTLQAEGVAIELLLVEKVPNEQALEIYRSADLIFDQCMIGFHGYFALEAMALGKPVMCFIRKPNEYLLYPDECPIINTHVSKLVQDLRHYATLGRPLLPQIGLRGRTYIEKHFTFQSLANRLRRAYTELGIVA